MLMGALDIKADTNTSRLYFEVPGEFADDGRRPQTGR
jgi:hypothetical protein